MPQVRIIAKNFMDMVSSLPAMKLDKLYENAFICEAILRSLPPLAKKYVLQLLYIDVPITASSLQKWVLSDGTSQHKVAVGRLIQLRVLFIEIADRKKEARLNPMFQMSLGTHINHGGVLPREPMAANISVRLISLEELDILFTETVDKKKEEATCRLNPMFQMNLRTHIVHGGVLPREPMAANITVRLPSLEELDNYAAQQWECFLLHLINSAEVEATTKSISPSMMKVFQRGLLSQKDREGALLTESGFQFLLMDTNAQLWYIIREYISNSEARGVDSADLISFLLELSFHVTGEAYNMNTLDEIQRITVTDLADLGLIKLQQGRKDSWFIPTKLATNLSISLSDASSRKQGYVVVETNFRLYAYSTSKLHCEILRLFARVEYQLPNLIVGSITKENLYKAFSNGITADQIILFLQQNAHPRVAEKVPSVPENVTDQIRLWESDLNRVEMTPAHFFDDFPSRDVFEKACDFARERMSLLWEDSNKMRLIVTTEIYAHMKDFLGHKK